MRLLAATLLLIAPLVASDRTTDLAYSHFYNLEYDEALDLIEEVLELHPDDPALHNHVAQILLFREMYRSGALESELVSGNDTLLRRPKLETPPEVDQRFHAEIDAAMRLAQARIEEDPDDAGALYALGISYGLRSNYKFLVRRNWMEALGDATSGRKLHNKVTEIDPRNIDARMMQGMHDYVVGSLPWIYKIAGFLIGFRGDREQGIRTLELVAREGESNRVDAEVILAVLYRREKRYKDALELVESLRRRFPRNYLLWFESAQMYSALGNKDDALGSIRQVAQRKRRGQKGFARVPWEKIFFQEGTIQFWYDELEEALVNFRKVAASDRELDPNTEVLTWLRMGQIYDLTGRRADAVEAYKKAIAAAPGAAAAKESNRYLNSPYCRRSG